MSIIWRIRCDGSKLSPTLPPHCLEDPAPHARRGREVVAARPLVVAEQHRAVLEGELAAVVVGEADDVRPDAERLVPVVVLVLRAVGAHERVDERDVHRLGGGDHVAEVADDLLAMLGIGMERVRVVAETGDGQALRPRSRRRARRPRPPTGSRRRCGWCRRSGGSARWCAASRRSRCSRSRWRPSSRRRPSSGVSGNGAVSRPSLIGRASRVAALAAPTGTGSRTTSTQRPRRALSAIASLTSISSWPSAKVG